LPSEVCLKRQGRWPQVAEYGDPPTARVPGPRALKPAVFQHLEEALGRETQHPRRFLYGVVTDLPARAASLPDREVPLSLSSRRLEAILAAPRREKDPSREITDVDSGPMPYAPPGVLCKRRGDPLLRRGAVSHYGRGSVKGA
jgi:hypothetical protein